MITENQSILHVDGSLTEYIDKRGVLHKVAGLGCYLVVKGKIIDKYYKVLKDIPHLNHHEEYAIIEGLKWAKEKNIKNIRVKTDSLHSVNLFNHKKRGLNKTDKFFLLQYMMIEYSFEEVDIMYHNRSDDDLSHKLSRTYMSNLPKDIIRLHNENNKKISNYNILSDATYHCEKDIEKLLINSMKEIQFLVK